LLVPTAVGLVLVGKDFMPQLDEGAWVVSTITPAETSLEENNRVTGGIEGMLLDDPNVRETIRRNGRSERAIGCVLPVNAGEIIVNLKPKGERTDTTEAILANVREQVERIPGVAVAFTQPLQLKIDESLEGTPAPLQVKLFGPDILTLAEKGVEIREAMEEVRGLADVKMGQVTGIPQLQVKVNREAAARYGVSVGEISEIVRLAVGGEELTQLWRDQRAYGVFARFRDDLRNDPAAIGNLLVDTPSGQRIPLSQLASVTMTEGPNIVWREAMSRRLSIDASIQGRELTSVVNDIKARLAGIDLPPGYSVVFAGQHESQRRAMRALLIAAAAALFIVFMLLFTVLGSYSQSLMILATVPSAFVGGVASLWLAGETLNVSSAVGFIALFGIAVQNSLVLMTQTRGFIGEGHTREQAIRLASVQRLRPKLMTACCTALGLVPILLSGGIGAEIEKPLAAVMVGGLVTSTLFTLLVLPAVYLLVERARERANRAAATFS
jgi:cobalt-zinc-cadmium resistance protein CzcA